MATRNIVPRANEEGNIGTTLKNWLKGWFKDLFVSGEITDGTTGVSVTVANLDDAVDKKHTQNADTALGAQSENLDMNTHKIVGVVDPTTDQEGATKKYVDDNVGISDLISDTTPQLGGDLDLNGKNIDFPSVANISDVKDEDDMASDSATMLATQQSIKAYSDTKAIKHISINTQTDDYTLVIGDDGKLVDMNKGTAVILTVPANASVAFPTGTTIALRQKGAGKVTIAPVSGVTVDSQDGLVTTGQHAMVSILKVATDTWVVTGSLET